MKLIVCLDDKNGMLFNRRRQSADALVCLRILTAANGSPLWMNSYSRTLFGQLEGNFRVDERFLENAGQGALCFVEDVDVTLFMPQVEKIVVYRWNRVYPADLRFPSLAQWRLTECTDFEGSSHDRITQEVYVR